MANDTHSPPDGPLLGDSVLGQILKQNCEALSSEISAASRNPGRNFDVSDGKCIHSGEDGHLYSFRSDISLPIPPESPIHLRAEDDEAIPGLLLSQQDFEVVLQLSQSIGEKVPRAKVSSEPWFILKRLRERLASLLEDESGDTLITEGLLGLASLPQTVDERAEILATEVFADLPVPQLRPNTAQLRALGSSCGSSLHFIWGPPGTGKTANVAQVVRALVESGERALVMAHANVAVDVAMLRVSDAFSRHELLENGAIVRVGIPQLPEIRERDQVLPEGILKRSQPHLITDKQSLEAQLQKLLKALSSEGDPESKTQLRAKLKEVRLHLKATKQLIQEATTAIVQKAAVVGCTLSKFSLDDLLFQWPADAVVVDEVSMAPFPMVVAGALQAKKRLLIFGDFRQLPPIHLSSSREAAEWLGRDAFEVAGIKDNIDHGLQDNRVSLLDTQYRMARPICDVVSDLAYDQRLKSDPGVEALAAPTAAAEPWPSESLVLVDTSEMASACIQDPKPGSYSRINPVHACLGTTLANRLVTGGVDQVAVITPYTSQARLLSACSRKLGSSEVVTASTVHRFQGSERNAVIVDLTDAPLQRGASQLTGANVEKALRLLNVAISRAKGKLIVLADLQFIRRQHPASSPSLTAINLLRKYGTVVEVEPGEFLTTQDIDWLRWLDWAEAQGMLARSLQASRLAAVLNLPEPFSPSSDLIEAIREASLRLAKLTIFCPVSVARLLESTSADLRLKNRPGGVFALIDSDFAVLGGHSPAGALAAVEDRQICDVIREQLLGASLTVPGPDAYSEEALEGLFGRCRDCGESRRPREIKRGEWALQCTSENHPLGALTADILEEAVAAMGLTCSECGSRAEAKMGRHGLYLSCAGRSAGCTGRPPSLKTLFGGE